jgi:signal transduction histidine kinase
MRWRLIAVLVGFTAIVLLVQNIPLASYLRTVEYDRIVTGLQRDAFAIAGLAVESLEGEAGALTDAELSAVVDEYAASTGAVVVIVDDKGIVIAASDDSVGESYANRPEIKAALDEGRAVSGQRDSQTLGEPLLFVAVPVRTSTQTNLGAVRLSYPVSAIDEVVNSRVRGLFVAAAITLLAAAIIAALVASAVTRRIRRLRDAAEDIAEGDLAARADVSGSDEIAELADSFNTMADRVQHVVESQKGFAGDASHQLRTPLATLRLRLDRAAEVMDEDDPAVEQVDAARDEIDRLGRLVDGLLMLARADGREQETVPIDVSAVARDRIESWVPLAAERDITIVLDSPGMAVAQAVPSAVEQIVDNYVDNALDVVPDGSRIVVTVRSAPDGVVLTVDDEGPGLSREDRERAFDRFWRGRQDGGGSGLGLAVVASLAQAGGGSVWLDQSPAGGLRACAKFRS